LVHAYVNCELEVAESHSTLGYSLGYSYIGYSLGYSYIGYIV